MAWIVWWMDKKMPLAFFCGIHGESRQRDNNTTLRFTIPFSTSSARTTALSDFACPRTSAFSDFV